jgi:hypothetical protein
MKSSHPTKNAGLSNGNPSDRKEIPMLTSDELAAALPWNMRELNSRTNDGTTVALIYESTTDMVLLYVETEEWVATRPVPGEKASDAFNHPFCYLPPVPEENAGYSVKV